MWLLVWEHGEAEWQQQGPGPAKPKVLAILSFAEKACQPLDENAIKRTMSVTAFTTIFVSGA